MTSSAGPRSAQRAARGRVAIAVACRMLVAGVTSCPGLSLAADPLPPAVAASSRQMPLATTDAGTTAPATRSPRDQPLDLGPRTMHAAIAAANEDYAPASGVPARFGTGTTSRQARIDRAFEAASIEGCLTGGAYKFDPPVIGFIGFGGLLAAPWFLHSMATGRCKP